MRGRIVDTVAGGGRRRRGVRSTRFSNVVTVNHSTFLRAVEKQVEELGLDWSEFLRQGSTGNFADDRVRSLWTMVGADIG